jgi:hypothetical protein
MSFATLKMANALRKHNIITCLHKYHTIEELHNTFNTITSPYDHENKLNYIWLSIGYSEDELNHMWDSFLSDNLQMSGDDIIENSDNFDDWFTTGRSGGWLILKHKSNLIIDTESVIEDNLSYLNDLTDEITEEEYQEWKKFYEDDEETKKGSNLLKSFEIEVGDFENVKSAEDESKVAISSLEENIKELQNLEKDLDEVQKRIDTFWEDAEVNFEEYVENESKWRDSNQL